MIIAARAESMPLTARRGLPAAGDPMSACTSPMSGRLPSSVTVTAVPGTGCGRWSLKRPEGSATPSIPLSCNRKQPTSSAAPNRFLTPRTMRSADERSPSKCSTTSTRCSSDRGPAMAPSLVTWPTRMSATPAGPAALTYEVSAVVTARTWVTPPATPSDSVVDMVCTESTTMSDGRTCSMWPSAVCRSDSAARNTSSWLQPVRSARIRIWPADSSPERYRARRPASAQRCTTSSSSVDFPTPGSPASSVTEPGTSPPPSTRSSSLTPVWKCRVESGSIELMGTAGDAGTTARPDVVADDRSQNGDLVHGAPAAAIRAAPNPLGGDVLALRAAVLRAHLRTGLRHVPTVSVSTDRSAPVER